MNKEIRHQSTEKVILACKMFSTLHGQPLQQIVRMAVRKKFSQGEMIFTQGNTCPGVFVVDRGLVRIFRNGSNGQQHVLHLCGPGQSFAEVAVFADFPLPASAVAAQSTECVLIPTAALQAALASDHDLCRQMLSGMAFWTRHFVQLLDNIVLHDASERVAKVLYEAPQDAAGWLVLPGAKKDLANHLNLTSETFSRVLRRLVEQGILEIGPNNAHRVIDAMALAKLVARS